DLGARISEHGSRSHGSRISEHGSRSTDLGSRISDADGDADGVARPAPHSAASGLRIRAPHPSSEIRAPHPGSASELRIRAPHPSSASELRIRLRAPHPAPTSPSPSG